ncbi:glucose-6-phosphate dehydrogenase assembly protein OpcA [Actinomyces sp. B33]|uniref:glucose-6-phosphate dehydrogenase assembly protein OpcA n=1 Tax=Actinomyces sp. B33 TaxID=2942131 RepID=UPI0023417469|nr:glucose-6-phosphate dehydrogenase assembly protein OpcA [Actinomyces sp. B33]MDC4233287.1 glucose-6-phosphate dehydrogenase assembly protein OpcA [Actinomyces sp. B33]
MIIPLKDTTSSRIAARLVSLRDQQGASALGRVMTLLVVVPSADEVEDAIAICDAASREHPCRVIVVVDSPATGPSPSGSIEPRLDAELRVGDAAGPSDVVVLVPSGLDADDLDLLVAPLLLSDTPVVAYWPGMPPPSPGQHPLGRIAIRRITDSRGSECPVSTLLDLARSYAPGDTDLGWSGVTLWRALLAALVADFGSAPVSARVHGHATHPSSFLIAAWLRRELGVPVERETDPSAQTLTRVSFDLEDGSRVRLERDADSSVAFVHREGLDPASVNLPRRRVQDCLMEELRRLDPDVYYGSLITEDLAAFAPGGGR